MAEPSAKRRKTSGETGPRITDPRFANIQSDPRYRLPSKKEKVKLDKRFSRALRDEDFTKRAKVDRYGRPLHDTSATKRLRQKFEFDEDEEESDEPDDDDEVQAELQRIEKVHDPLREGRDVSSSEDDSSSDEDSEIESEDEDAGPGPQKEDVPLGEVSSRIAVVNLDWDNIRAEDLMAVFSSFLPATGRLIKVAVYPSEFGKERMEREELEGPPKEIFAPKKDEDEDGQSESEDDDEIKASIIKPDDGSEFDSAALRQYQLERLRYFYAVLSFSSAETAKAIYDSVDGTEYLSTANFFDLRFIPDDTDFSDDIPREECERLSTSYKPNEFVTDALQHSKVKLTWDAEDGGRKDAVARAFKGGRKEIDENDLKAYLGSDTSSDEDEDAEMLDTSVIRGANASEALHMNGGSKKEAERQKMRALLGLAPEPVKKTKKDKNAPVGDIQITFSSGLGGQRDNSDKKRSVFENSPEPDETTMEKYVRKERERKQKRKERMKAARGDPGAEDVEEAAKQAEEDVGDRPGFDDPFFDEPMVDDRKSANKLRKEERIKKRKEREEEEAASAKQRAELELLMGSDNEDHDDGKKSGGRTVKHFDMNDIEKAEKFAKKKNKKAGSGKKRQATGSDALAGDDFKVQTNDPRFARLFENHEYAIDPTNPRYKGTKGMQTLLEEGRKRKHEEVPGQKDQEANLGQKGRGTKKETGSDVKSLVEKIRKKNR